ncbi:MAG: hypothetical protein IH969_02875 [Candidatus Krumholzibacteriota bacterium]|nr:hypothetical protein [Candidatus Krumholzibacteriota bacterium]
MNKKTIGRNVLSALAMMIAVSAPAQDNFVSAPPQDNIEKLFKDLKPLYPSGMFVTGYKLVQIRAGLLSASKDELHQRVGAESIEKIEGIIEKGGEYIIGEIAFVHIDLKNLDVFIMWQKGSGPDCQHWNEVDVKPAAVWLHEFLLVGAKRRKNEYLVRTGEMSLGDAISSLDEFSNSIYVSETESADYKREVRALFAQKSDEIAALEDQQPELHAKIDKFRNAFDAELDQQVKMAWNGVARRNKIISEFVLSSHPENRMQVAHDARFAIDSISRDGDLLKTILAKYRGDT